MEETQSIAAEILNAFVPHIITILKAIAPANIYNN